MSVCSVEECGGQVAARGMCSKHYQRWQRENKGEPPVRRGPAPKYPEEIRKRFQGAPILTVRLEPELWEWAQALGGAAWVRHALTQLRELATDENFTDYWARFSSEAEGG